LRPERANPISRVTQAIYLPTLKFCLRHRWLTIVVNLIFLLVTFPLATRLGSQFVPALFEGSALYMPTALSTSMSRSTARRRRATVSQSRMYRQRFHPASEVRMSRKTSKDANAIRSMSATRETSATMLRRCWECWSALHPGPRFHLVR
jgi:Cu/Ag efflux pump CusA